jgi:Flp pilus assembly protein TadG
MKPAASFSQARLQLGAAAVELAMVLSATIVLMPAVALFARVFYQYCVAKEATRDAAAYMASLPPAAFKDSAETARAIDVAKRIVSDAAQNAGMDGTTTVAPAYVECDQHVCFKLVPALVSVTVTFSINDEAFNALTGAWTDHESKIWQVSAKSSMPFSR